MNDLLNSVEEIVYRLLGSFHVIAPGPFASADANGDDSQSDDDA